MRRLVFALALVLALCVIHLPASCQQETTAAAPGHYLFAWTGDAAKKGNDFLAVIDADPSSPSYGRLVTTLATDQQTKLVHHTEYVMPASGLLFANDHEAGRTFIFDVRNPSIPRSRPRSPTWPVTCTLTLTCVYPTATCWPRFSMRMTA